MSDIKRIDCRTRIDCPNHGIKFGYCEECLFPAPPAPQGSGEHKLVAGERSLDWYKLALSVRDSQLLRAEARLAEVEAARDQALTLGAKQVLEIQELRQVVKEYGNSDRRHGRCFNGLEACSLCKRADALLEPKAKPTQQEEK